MTKFGLMSPVFRLPISTGTTLGMLTWAYRELTGVCFMRDSYCFP